MIPNVLSIAGSDPSGGAGIQADLKTIAANGGYGMAAITALTAQNTCGVQGVEVVPAAFVRAQLEAVFADVRVDAVKIGMVATAEIAEIVADVLDDAAVDRVVLDPVMVAKGGSRLLADEAVDAVRSLLLPQALVVTPNLGEAAALLGVEHEARSEDEMREHAMSVLALGARHVLLKGGHLGGETSPDVLVARGGAPAWFRAERHPTKNTHGTGCTLSSALATQLARGAQPVQAVQQAKSYVGAAIRTADELHVGQGHGPTNHFGFKRRS